MERSALRVVAGRPVAMDEVSASDPAGFQWDHGPQNGRGRLRDGPGRRHPTHMTNDRRARDHAGQFRGHQRAELVATSGQVCWPPVGRNQCPLTLQEVRAKKALIAALRLQLAAFEQQMDLLEQALGPLQQWAERWSQAQQAIIDALTPPHGARDHGGPA